MIENFLVDPEVIFEAIESVLERTAFRTVDDVEGALEQLVTAYEPNEVSRRTAAILLPSHFYPGRDVVEITTRAQTFAQEVLSRYSEASVIEARQAAETAVADVRTRMRRREEFDGKQILREFFQQHLRDSTLSRQVFAFYAARRARRRRSVREFFDGFFEAQRIVTREPPRHT